MDKSTPAAPGEGTPRFQQPGATPAAPPIGPDRAWLAAGLIAMAVAAAGLAVIAFGYHPIGDYFAESDFYGGYAAGARLVQQGRLEFSRYGVYGPVYEWVLALVGFVIRDPFDGARLISIGAAATILANAWRLARRRFGPAAAFWLVALIAVNPTFVRYGYSVGTDMLACALWMASVTALLTRAGTAGVIAAGIWAALAVLTRYNLASLVPAGVVLLLCARGPARERLASAGAFVGGFLLIAAPFTIAATAAGHPPGITLLRDSGFYLNESPAEWLEDRYGGLAPRADPAATAAAAAPGSVAAPEMPATPAGSTTHSTPATQSTPSSSLVVTLARRLLTGIPGHIAADAGLLLGWPATGLALAAIGALLLRRRAGMLLVLVPFVAFTFLALAPVFFSRRYSLVLVPLYLVPAAILLGDAWPRRRMVRAAIVLAGVVVLGLTLRDSILHQRAVYEFLPAEALASGRVLRAAAKPGDRVLTRKAHVAFAAGLEPVLFPDVDSIGALGAYCRDREVGFLYYSWYEVGLRPRFAFLLDTAAAVPGLVPLFATRDKPSATYRVSAGFGAPPAWWADSAEAQRISTRVRALLLRPADAGPLHLELAANALDRGVPGEALAEAEAAARVLPRRSEPQVLRGEALRRLGRASEALDAFERAIEIRPEDLAAHRGRGMTLLDLGRNDDAAREWRALIPGTRDEAMLRAMISLFAATGDSIALQEARAMISGLESWRRSEAESRRIAAADRAR